MARAKNRTSGQPGGHSEALGGLGNWRRGGGWFPAGRWRGQRKTENLGTWEPAMGTGHPGSFSGFQNFRFSP